MTEKKKNTNNYEKASMRLINYQKQRKKWNDVMCE